MKEKIKRDLFIITEIGTVIWAIFGMWETIRSKPISSSIDWESHYKSQGSDISFIAFYFFSAVLILYLIEKYGRN